MEKNNKRKLVTLPLIIIDRKNRSFNTNDNIIMRTFSDNSDSNENKWTITKYGKQFGTAVENPNGKYWRTRLYKIIIK